MTKKKKKRAAPKVHAGEFMSYREVGEHAGMSAGQAHKNCTAIIAKFAKAMAGHYISDEDAHSIAKTVDFQHQLQEIIRAIDERNALK